MNEITITIDGKEIKTSAESSILEIARANNVYIPAICFLTRCSPTLACKLCMVEADGKRVYSCNAKAKDQMNIITESEALSKDRQSIMEVYDVNHPLQCGVCDKSGECELQDNNLFQNVHTQNQCVPDIQRPIEIWGKVKYDGALCIVCERCVTVCKDMIGDSALSTVKRGGPEIDASFKESMEKDPYGVWNKLNKSLIGMNKDVNSCSECGECAAVCPTGALVYKDFQYTANAWELTTIPSTCVHCSSGCQVMYEVKHTKLGDQNKKIYRTKNDFHFESLCGAGRFAFDFENRVQKDSIKFAKAILAFKDAKTISFNSLITNEEAFILQKLKEKFGYKLYNQEALNFQNFMKSYSSVSGKSLYSGDRKGVHQSNFVISIGTSIKSDNPILKYALNNSIKMNKGAGLYFHPVKDPIIETMQKNLLCINNSVASEEALMYLLLDLFANKDTLPKDVVDYINSFKQTTTKVVKEKVKEKIKKDDGSEEEITKEIEKTVNESVNTLFDQIGSADLSTQITALLAKKDKFTLIAGEDLINHPRAKNIAKLLALFEKHSNFDLIIVPPKTNTLGVSLICDLDSSKDGYTIGYNEDGDFVLTSLGAKKSNELDMPALNQQEGTFVSLDKRVVALNAALEYDGFSLGHIAKELGIEFNYTIDFTQELPILKGFKTISFDNLKNEYSKTGDDQRGYKLDLIESNSVDEVKKFEKYTSYTNTTVYRCNPILQFNEFTAKSTITKDSIKLYASKSFLEKNGLQNSQLVTVTNQNASIELEVLQEDRIAGDIALVPDFIKTPLFNESDYRFSQVTIKVGQ